MSENKHTGGSRSGRGYYIALVLCAAVIGITSYVYYRNANTPQEVLLQQTEPIPVGTMEAEPDIPVIATQPRQESTGPAPTEQTAPKSAAKKKLKVVSPVAGQEIFGYSMETLSYNETTRDWRVHNGVVLAAEEGTPVCAACDGTVMAVREDDVMGNTVEIRHEGGYTTCYSSLGEELAVSAGDTVTAGQTIGYAGSTALVETAMGSHVHFSVTSQGDPMDPAEFLALGE